MKAGDKYRVPDNEREGLLPNLLGITNEKELELEEARGFVTAQIDLRASLDENTQFDLAYIMNIHKLALGHIYDFAGKPRKVDMSKGGFRFPSALHLNASLQTFDKDILSKVRGSYKSEKHLIEDIATVHAELLFIHPFREGNGRTARILANLMAEKAGYDRLPFEKFDNEEMFKRYIKAVQMTAGTYEPMKALIALLFQP
jgi:cell filamentation protein